MNSQFKVTSLASELHLAGPEAALSITMRSDINAISGAVDWLMTMISAADDTKIHDFISELRLAVPVGVHALS